jgi:hypothetical protein
VVLAVNGYDEPRPVVEKFVREKGLRQRVLLGGRRTALSLYGVTGFPTSFLIDRRGTVVERQVGFLPARAGAIEARIEALLGR